MRLVGGPGLGSTSPHSNTKMCSPLIWHTRRSKNFSSKWWRRGSIVETFHLQRCFQRDSVYHWTTLQVKQLRIPNQKRSEARGRTSRVLPMCGVHMISTAMPLIKVRQQHVIDSSAARRAFSQDSEGNLRVQQHKNSRIRACRAQQLSHTEHNCSMLQRLMRFFARNLKEKTVAPCKLGGQPRSHRLSGPQASPLACILQALRQGRTPLLLSLPPSPTFDASVAPSCSKSCRKFASGRGASAVTGTNSFNRAFRFFG